MDSEPRSEPPRVQGEASPAPRRIYVRYGPQAWEAARRLYGSGLPAGEVARTLGMSVSALRLAASRGGWTRRDLARAAADAADGTTADGATAAAAPAGEAQAGAGRFDPPLPLDDPARGAGPTWFRLPDDAWAMIRGEYIGGATAKALSAKWGVSATSIYRHAGEGGWTKVARGAAVGALTLEREIAARARLAGQRDAEAAQRARAGEREPVESAETLVRRAAALALAGATEEAALLVKVAEALMRAAYAVPGSGEPGWRDGGRGAAPEAAQALEARRDHLCALIDRRRGGMPTARPPDAPPG